MTSAFKEIPDTIPPGPNNFGECCAAPRSLSLASHDNFSWRQFRAVGLEAVAEKIATGCALELAAAVALSRASLPLLGKMIELQAAASGVVDTSAAGLLRIERVASLPLRYRIGQALTDWESFCQRLIALRGEVSPGGDTIFWYPILGQPLDRDRGSDNDFSGAEVLRAIALARLVLPAEIEVQAPLAVLGPKLAQVALDFGASHLGYAALDGQTPDDPLVADPRELDELLGSCLPTSLKEETQPPLAS